MALMIRASFLILFSALVLAPLAQMATRLVPEAALVENRALAPLPALELSHKAVRAAQDWFNDHFGLRSLLIRIKTQIDYSLFRTSDRVHIGQRGWLFYRSVLDVERPRAEAYLAQNGPAVRDGVAAFSAALARHGVNVMVTITEMADRFYPDMVPGSALPPPPDPRLRRLVRDLGGLETPSVIDSTSLLTELGKERQTHHKTDFHWNDPAAFAVAQRMVALASAAEGRERSAWAHPLAIETTRISGGIASFMPLLRAPTEMALFVKPTWTTPPNVRTDPARGAFEYSIHIPRDGVDRLGPLVLLGDSFSDGLIRAGLYLSFTDTWRSHWFRTPKLSTLAAELPLETRHLVMQAIEVQMVAFGAFADREDIARAVAIIDERFAGRAARKP